MCCEVEHRIRLHISQANCPCIPHRKQNCCAFGFKDLQAQKKTMRPTAMPSIRRYVQHVLPVQRERQMRTTVMDLGSVAATGSVSSRNCYPVFGPLRLRASTR